MDRPPPATSTSSMMSPWRLLLDFERPGAHHMATDAALHAGFVAGRDRPVLRLYSWAPACLSLGYAQSVAEVDLGACARAGVAVVRRPSGGRAVLHDRELTYAVIASVDDPLVGGPVGAAYRAIATGLLAGLRALGVTATLAPGRPDGDLAARRSGACFAAASRHEIVWQGRKLVGSAQMRRHGVLLQHGSILLERGQTALSALLRVAPANLDAHLAGVGGTVAEALGRPVTAPDAARIIAPAFAAALGLTLQPDDLTPAEVDRAAGLSRDHYATRAWTALR